MVTLGQRQENITKISQVTPEVTLFLRNLGFSNYYIIKIFDLVGEAAVALTEDNPYWVLDEFPRMGFAKADEAAKKLGVEMTSQYRISSAVNFAMKNYIGQGHSFAPVSDVCDQVAQYLDLHREFVQDVLEDMALTGRIQITNLNGSNVCYFYGYYRAECLLAARLADLADPIKGIPPIAANKDALIRKVEAASGIKLSQQQKDAVKGALENGVSIITGGPGTGKTTIINTLIAIMEENGFKVAVAAPTGRAAKRITETSGKFASTVHRLLEYYYDETTASMTFGKNSQEPLEYGAVIIDEASMLDLLLTEALCDALKSGTRLILVGDADQLPSVGAGNVLGDLIDSDFFYTARLTEVFRQAEESMIIVNAHRINHGEYPRFERDFQLLRCDKQADILENIIHLATETPLNKLQIITPAKKGIVGSENLNLKLQEVLNPPDEEKTEIKFGKNIFRAGDRVMQKKNNYRLEFKRPDGRSGKGVFNGETGTVVSADKDMCSVTVEYDDERWVEYPYILLDEIELAYALTVHKSQGSEFATVIMPMTWFPPILATRNLIYTAVTRGKEKVIIVGNPAYLNGMVDNNRGKIRNSGLKDRITGLYEPL